MMGEDQTSVLDLAANYEKFGDHITQHIAPYFEEYGLNLTKMLVENISLPDEVERAVDLRSSREMTGNLDAHIKYQGAQALGSTQSGISEVVGIGAGMAVGHKLAKSMEQQEAVPPPLPDKEAQYFIALNGASKGPYNLIKVEENIKKGKINRETLLWRTGMPNWEAASKVMPQYFISTPPPLP
jgi:hypothetical protein